MMHGFKDLLIKQASFKQLFSQKTTCTYWIFQGFLRQNYRDLFSILKCIVLHILKKLIISCRNIYQC